MSCARPPLLDRFGRRHTYLRISVTDRCNFRCSYCMPHEDMEWAPRSEILTFEEIERLARLFADMGVNKVRLTGGEPTTRKGFVELVRQLHQIEGFGPLLMTTNGDALSTMAQPLRDAGVGGVNISLDTLNPGRFFDITHRNRLDRVLAGIEAALQVGFQPLKINVVVMAGVNDDELCDFIARFLDHPIEVRFIEFMPFLSNSWQPKKLVPYADMRRRIESQYRLTAITTEPTAVAKEFQVEGGQARVGFITSMTDDFCSGCNRVRLTADGRLKVCLFAKSGPSLRDLMRAGTDDDKLAEEIRTALDAKWASHPPMTHLIQTNDRPMISIGG